MQSSFHSLFCNEKITPYSLISKHAEAVQNGGANGGAVADTKSIRRDDSVGKRRPPATVSATAAFYILSGIVSKLLKGLEARVGIEPTHKGFADLSLTTWVPRLGRAAFFIWIAPYRRSQPGWRRRAEWSGRRDLNSRPSPWQGDALPLSYSRLLQY